MKMRRWNYVFWAFSMLLLTLPIGESSWLGSKTASDSFADVVTESSDAAVAYIGSTYYTDLGRALYDAASKPSADEIFVIPGESSMNVVSLNASHATENKTDGRWHYTVASNDVLLLPYDSDGSYDSIDSFDRDTDSTDNYDDGPSDTLPESWCRLRVIMEENVAIDCYGTLRIGGEVGGDAPQGATHGRYAELVMGKNNLLTMGNGTDASTLWCHGFIRDTEEYIDDDRSSDNEYTKIVLNNGASANEPMTVYGWGSAGNVLGKMYCNVFVFDRYELPNIRPKMRVNYGASLTAQAYMHGTTMGNQNTAGNIIGAYEDSDALLLPSPGSYAIWNYDNTDEIYKSGKENTSSHMCAISLYGGYTVASFAIEAASRTIDTAEYYFPIPYQYDMNLKSGTTYVKNKLKFLPGSELRVEEGASVVVEANFIAYADNKGGTGTAIPDYPVSTAAKVINNGTVTAQGVAITATILTETEKGGTASIKFTNCPTVTDCYECTPGSIIFDSEKHGPYEFNRQCYYEESTTMRQISDTDSLISNSGADYFVDPFSVSLSPSGGTSGKNEAASYTVEAIPYSGVADYTYEWSISPSLDLSVSGDAVSFTTPANAEVDNITYTLTCNATSSNGETYTVAGYYVARGTGIPLSLETDHSDESYSTGTNESGSWNITATASGGSGSYQFEWEVTTQISTNKATVTETERTANTSKANIVIPKTNDSKTFIVTRTYSQTFEIMLTLTDTVDGGSVSKTWEFIAKGDRS